MTLSGSWAQEELVEFGMTTILLTLTLNVVNQKVIQEIKLGTTSTRCVEGFAVDTLAVKDALGPISKPFGKFLDRFMRPFLDCRLYFCSKNALDYRLLWVLLLWSWKYVIPMYVIDILALEFLGPWEIFSPGSKRHTPGSCTPKGAHIMRPRDSFLHGIGALVAKTHSKACIFCW